MGKNKYRFIKIRCSSCKSEQIIFEGATVKVKCPTCENILTEPKGGKAGINARIIEVLS